MTTLSIPKRMDARLAVLAKHAQVPKKAFALQGLEEFLEDQEDCLIALELSERIEKGLEPTFSLEEALKELGLDAEDIH